MVRVKIMAGLGFVLGLARAVTISNVIIIIRHPTERR